MAVGIKAGSSGGGELNYWEAGIGAAAAREKGELQAPPRTTIPYRFPVVYSAALGLLRSCSRFLLGLHCC